MLLLSFKHHVCHTAEAVYRETTVRRSSSRGETAVEAVLFPSSSPHRNSHSARSLLHLRRMLFQQNTLDSAYMLAFLGVQ